jgi:mRNA interferase MazF
VNPARPAQSAPRRGEVWTVDFGEPVGHEQAYRRPAIVVSSDRLNQSRAGLVVVVPLTRTRRDLPSHIEIEVGESGLSETSFAKTEDIKSISNIRLVRRLGQVPSANLDQIGRALLLLLELA